MASFAMSSREIERGICGSTVGAGSMEARRVAHFPPRPPGDAPTGGQFFHTAATLSEQDSSGTGLASCCPNGREADMGHNNDLNGLEEFLAEFRAMLPPKSETAQAIDRHAPFEQIAFKAIDDGYIDFADQFSRFVETCLRRNL